MPPPGQLNNTNPAPPLSQQKPFPVPVDLIGTQVFELTTVTGIPSGGDGLRRTKRLLDSYEPGAPGAAAATPKPFLATAIVASGSQEMPLQAFGAAYLSVLLDHNPAHSDSFPNLDYPPVKVHLDSTGQAVRFRIFTVGMDDKPMLLNSCKSDWDGAGPGGVEQCKPDLEDFVVDRIVNSSFTNLQGQTFPVKEILVVASAGMQPAAFTWSIGPAKPHLEILAPTTSLPVPIGEPAGGDFEKQPFLVQFTMSDEDNSPVTDVEKEDVDLVVTTPAKTCTFAPQSLVNQSGGLYWAVANVPDDCYPAPPMCTPSPCPTQYWDLEVKVNKGGAPPSASQPESLVLHMKSASVALQLVIDRSASMSGLDIDAAVKAGSLLVETLRPGDSFGLVTFNDDAQTVYPPTLLATEQSIGGAAFALAAAGAAMDPLGCTSMGDGVLEAQSNLAAAYDDLQPADRPTYQTMVVFSDAVTNAYHKPSAYYLGTKATEDGGGFFGEAPPPQFGPCQDTSPNDQQPWANKPLGRPNRKGLPLPSVSCIAMGPLAAQEECATLAAYGGGTYAYIPSPSEQSFMMLGWMADAAHQAIESATGHKRVNTYRTVSIVPSELPELSVEPDASELLVSVVSPRDAVDRLRLVSPSGIVVAPAHARTESAVFRVASPEPGEWSWQVDGDPPLPRPPSDQPVVWVEHAVKSSLAMFATADVEGALAVPPTDGSTDDRRWVRKPVTLRAALSDMDRFSLAEAVALVQTSGGTLQVVTLADDGLHDDGAAGDGMFAARFANTAASGSYTARIVAGGISTTGALFRRERTVGFHLHEAPDTDADNLPDWWEERFEVDDADEDPDGDGLSNGREYASGTLPLDDDTDGGGENDASEKLQGRNPLDRTDDAIKPRRPTAIPGNGRVLIDHGILPSAAGTTLEIERAPELFAPYTQIFSGSPPPGILGRAAANDELAWYRTRTIVGGVTSAWSAPVSALPRADPFAPKLELALTSDSIVTRTRKVTLLLDATDSPEARHLDSELIDPAAIESGVSQMMIAFRADFQGASWEPFSEEVPLWLNDAAVTIVYAKVRDGAGNESPDMALALHVRASTELDASLNLVEHALDQLHVGAYAAAKATIDESLDRLDASIKKVKTRIKAASPPDTIDTQLHVGLEQVRGKLHKAKALAMPQTSTKAETALEETLVRQRSLAALAEQYHKEL